MADLGLQIKIQTNAAKAVEEFDQLNESLQNLPEVANEGAEGLTGVDDNAQAASESVGALANEVEGLGSKAGDLDQLADSLDRFEKSAKKLGVEFSQLVTAPVAALAGISLKNLYDVGALADSTGPAREFALSVQGLRDNFNDLTMSLAQEFLPAAQKVIGFFNNLINSYRNLAPSTKEFITNFALAAAAIGPVILGFSSLLSISLKLAPIFSALGTGLSAIVLAINPLVALIGVVSLGLAGLVNVFTQLRDTGMGVFDSLSSVMRLFVTSFNNYVIGTILEGIRRIVSITANIASYISPSLSKGLQNASKVVDDWNKNLESQFSQTVSNIDSQLSKVGSSTATAMTLGLNNTFNDVKSSFDDLFKSQTNNAQMLDSEYEAWKNQVYEVHEATDEFYDDSLISAETLSSNISGGMTGSIMEFAQGTVTAGQAFRNFANQVVSNLTRMILEAQIFNALMGLTLGRGSGTGGNSASLPTRGPGQVMTPGFASGGHVRGPGTGTSDSILARLSNGEFVTDARTVRHFGVEFFNNLKSMARSGSAYTRPSSLPAFANGGVVSSSANAPQVVIENRGAPKEAVSTSYDPATAVMTVFIDDLSRNGPMSKGIQSTFGISRGGMR